jgi:L-serine dehydratase
VDLDATIAAMAQTAKDMNNKYKETSQAGLALSVTLC